MDQVSRKQGCCSSSRQEGRFSGSKTIILRRKAKSISLMGFPIRLQFQGRKSVLVSLRVYRIRLFLIWAVSTPRILTIFWNWSSSEVPLNSRAPVCMKQKMHPKDQVSIFPLYRFSPTSSSGARQQRVPTWFVMSRPSHACSLVIPKSISLRLQKSGVISRASTSGAPPMLLDPSMMLEGLMSRCRMPLECRCSIARTISRKNYLMAYFRLLLSTCSRVVVSHSMIMRGGSSAAKTSRTLGRCVPARVVRMQCSLTKLVGSPMRDAPLKRLTATTSLDHLSSALQTSPQEPQATRSSRQQRSVILPFSMTCLSIYHYSIISPDLPKEPISEGHVYVNSKGSHVQLSYN